MKQPSKQPKPLKDLLFERIESENVCPRSRWFYRSQECTVWTLWLLSVVVGAFAVAISVFVVTHHQYALYEATHLNFFTYLVDALPYAWLIIFGLMVYVAIYNVRHTRYGYRYPLAYILSSSIILAFAGGSAMQFFGFGYKIDQILGEQMSVYVSQEKFEKRLWQTPADGRLVGRQVLSTVAPTSTIIFEDIEGVRWTTDISELMPRDIELLATGKLVRVLGHPSNVTLRQFHSCGAIPWMMSPQVTTADMSKEREAFIERVMYHANRYQAEMLLAKAQTVASTTVPQHSVCAGLAVVRRIPVHKDSKR